MANNLVELSFAWDPTEPVATRPLVMQRNGGWNFFYTHDGNKNVSDVVSFQQARSVPAHYEYAPFGAVTAVVTNTAITVFNVATTNPFRFSSEYSDDTLGMVYYNYRHYELVTGRWFARDLLSWASYKGLQLTKHKEMLGGALQTISARKAAEQFLEKQKRLLKRNLLGLRSESGTKEKCQKYFADQLISALRDDLDSVFTESKNKYDYSGLHSADYPEVEHKAKGKIIAPNRKRRTIK